MNNTYIVHTGIKGMRWGIRRYQNPDGTLTEEGKKRYENSSKKKYIKSLSDEELKAKTERLKLENEYAHQTNELERNTSFKGAENAKNAIKKIDMTSPISNAAKNVATIYAGAKAIEGIIKLIGNRKI